MKMSLAIQRRAWMCCGFLALILFAVCSLPTQATRAQDAPTYASPTAIVTDGTVLYVACGTSPKILKLNAKSQKLISTIQTDAPVTGIALGHGKLYVTQGLTPGKLTAIDLKTHKSTDIRTGLHSPCAPVVAGRNVFVADRFRNVVVNGMTGKTIPVSREPVAMAVTPDGKTLIVGNLLPAGRADGNEAYCQVSFIDTTTDKLITELNLDNGATSLRGVAISPDGKFAYLTHILARYQLPTTQIERGWINTNALAILDIEKRTLLSTVLLDDVDLGAANPWGVAVSPNGKTVVVTHAGTHELSIIDRDAMHKRIAEYRKNNQANEVQNKLSFLAGIRRRLELPEGNKGPRSVAITGRIAWVPMYFSDSMIRVELDNTTPRACSALSLGPKIAITPQRQGEIYFHDAVLCLQKWQSCSSCHPDARADALNWDLLNDGMGNPKQTRTMLYTHYTPPVMITGIRATAEVAVRAGIKYIQFAIRPESDAKALDAWLKTLKAVPSPYLVNGKLSAKAQRGKTVFTKAGCAKCHSGKYFTDLETYDVKLSVGNEEGTKFDTPTLLECWRTGPYLYDGRAKTMMDVLTTFNKNDTHGTTSTLSRSQLEDLNEYILSL
ncbi:MAG: cell surface protein [Phycisphaerales bacterium]|jgi:DNA-binding beta-propeller fold protein YncE|nr:cell surface protein [Phycisphaerales bacterium]MBT7170162.1 cell surface protein [Phycisphaerales bacterium]